MTDENVEVVKRIEDAWNDGDLSGFLDFFDEYVVMVPVPNHPEPEPVHGREGVLEFSERWLAPWDTYRFETENIVASGDAVVWTMRQHGTQNSTGLTMDTSMSAVFAFRQGKIVQVRWFWDKAEALEVVGLT
jgi:ketosteroid isomerase-like protein